MKIAEIGIRPEGDKANAPVICNCCHPYHLQGRMGDSGAKVLNFSIVPTVQGKRRGSYIWSFTPVAFSVM